MNLDDSSDRNGQPIDPSYGLDDDVGCLAVVAGLMLSALLAGAIAWLVWTW